MWFMARCRRPFRGVGNLARPGFGNRTSGAQEQNTRRGFFPLPWLVLDLSLRVFRLDSVCHTVAKISRVGIPKNVRLENSGDALGTVFVNLSRFSKDPINESFKIPNIFPADS